MATVVYYGFQTASILSGVSNKVVMSSIELCIYAASSALKAFRPLDNGVPVGQNPLVKDELETLDIEAKLKTVQALVLMIQKYRNENESEVIDDSDVVGVCLMQVKDVLESLTTTLNGLRQELNDHDQRWFSSWRTPDTKNHMIALRSKILILDKRVDMLLKVRSFVSSVAPLNQVTSL